MTVAVFDMDDTLYDEMTYVHSGFRQVSKFLSDTYGLPADEMTAFLLGELETNGRGALFNELLLRYGRYSKTLVAGCIAVYRAHVPQIQLLPDAEACLNELKEKFPLYLVTDGNKLVQSRKVKALRLDRYMKHCYITHRYGVRNAKPSPYVFEHICRREQTSPDKVIYVGDNPNKDFVGIKPLGIRTVRVLRGSFRFVEKPPEYEADHQIHTLEELSADFVRTITAG